MALAYPLDRRDGRYVVTSVDDGKFLVLGEPSPTSVGVWSVTFAPDDDWVGSFEVVARARGKGAGDDAAGFGTIGYIRAQVNAAAADQGLTNDPIAGHATIWVRAGGLSVALATEWTAGTCTIYCTPLEGDVSPVSLVTS